MIYKRSHKAFSRIDIQCGILPVPFEKLSSMADGELRHETERALRSRFVAGEKI